MKTASILQHNFQEKKFWTPCRHRDQSSAEMLSEYFPAFQVTGPASRLSGAGRNISNLKLQRQPISRSTKKIETLPQNDTGLLQSYYL